MLYLILFALLVVVVLAQVPTLWARYRAGKPLIATQAIFSLPQLEMTLAQRARQWVGAHLNQTASERELQAWLHNLPQEGFKRLIEEMATVFGELGLDLRWLVGPDRVSDPPTQAILRRNFIDYAVMCRQTALDYAAVERHQQRLEIIEKLLQTGRRDHVRRVLSRLHEQNLLDAPRPEALFASTTARREIIRQGLYQAIARDVGRVDAILHETLNAK